jgi:hypothetical protein
VFGGLGVQMTGYRAAVTGLGIAMAAVGCAAGGGDAPVPVRAPESAAGAAIQTPYVPKGTEFMVSLDQTIGTADSKAGDRFTGRLLGPLRAASGEIVVPSGAWIEGRVTRVDPDYLPDLRVMFTRIDSTAGPLPIHATIRHAGKYAWANPHAVYDPEGLGHDAILYHPQVNPGAPAIGGGPSEHVQSDPQIRLPKGAELDLILARPLVIGFPRR